METLKIQNLNFTYPGRVQCVIHDLSLSVDAGDFVVLCGPSGCGKSTLLRQLKPILAPHGTLDGEIFFEGQPLESLSHRTQAEKIGFVQQSPENQIVTDKVWHELAFGLESLGYDTPTIRKRVAEMASFFGIEGWFYENITDLSGGQKQLLNLASVMVMQPSVLILDEPTSQLDPIAASDFLATLGKINRELGTTVILTEHRLEEAFPLATKVCVMDRGSLLCVGRPAEVGKLLKEQNHAMFLAMPTPMRVWAATESTTDCPVTVRDGRQWLEAFGALRELPEEELPARSEEVAICAKGLWFKYEKDAPDVVRGLDLTVHKGEFFAILGGNGTGKSTSLKLLSGLLKPYRGAVQLHGSVGVLPQDPQALFVKKTVREDLCEISTEIGPVVKLCRLEELLDRHPFDLSGGEQQRAALAKVLLLDPDILLLDEPTKGLDAEFKQEFAKMLQALLHKGVSILMVSHDVEFCARYAHRCALFFDGSIVTEARPRAFFSGNSFYTTSANRMARTMLPQAVTSEDLIYACGGEAAVTELPRDNHELPAQKERKSVKKEQVKKNLPKRTIVSAFLMLLLIPLTLYIGERYFGGRKYLAISLLVMLEMMLPFFLVFEGRKPQARELVIIAVLCAIGVAGRAIFFMLPEFKPVWALTIIAGVAFGGETGFVVGAMTMLCSNVLFGQGPWTPWQMFSMGIIGFLAGVLFRNGSRKRLPLCLYGAVSCIVIYGGIMNPASAVMALHDLSWQAVLPYFISGFPVDCVHAAATAIFLWFAAEPMLEKLDRIKIKYNLIE